MDQPVARRLVQLYAGLVLFGVSVGMVVLSALGNAPWDVLHQGLARHTGIGTGTWAVLVSVVVLLLWIPLRQRPGLGTISNAILVGLTMDVLFALADTPESLVARWALLLGGVLLNGVATGMYIGAHFGPGPRDGLMTGLAARGRSVRAVRTSIELVVLAIGVVLGGRLGVGTLVYALGIGPLAHVFIPVLETRRVADREAGGAAGGRLPARAALGTAGRVEA
jgi:uncharacterized membrane protein YczE